MGAKLLLEARDIQVTYALRRVLDVARLELYDGDRVGLVGENGCGKSTLLRVLAGELEPDRGRVNRWCEVSLIAQLGDANADCHMDARLKSEFAAKELREGLSGGEHTRRRIAAALTGGAHALLADEPTVDLDASGVEALTKRLNSYEGAVVLVSHDRSLLDSVCTRILELAEGKILEYPGNYTAYRRERERRYQFEKDEYEAYRAEQARIRGMIQRETEHASKMQHLPKRMGNSEARLHKREVTVSQGKVHQVRKSFESRLERLPEKRRPREDVSIRMALGASGGITSKIAAEASALTMRFGPRALIENASFVIPTRSRTALMGDNGCGKTTLLRRIISKDGVYLSPGVKIGYFGQDHADVLDMDKSALTNVMENCVFDESTARTVLARLNIRTDDVFKRAGVLSGGERAKVCMARLFVSDVNFLILDEPTNHLDVFSMEALEGVLKEYQGTLILVSHDRRFVEGVANRLIFFENARLRTFEGDLRSHDRARPRADEALEIEIAKLEMRLTLLSARLSAPRKGDSPDKLNAEYLELSQELQTLRAQRQS